MDGAGDAVLELEVHLGYCVLGEDGGIRDITCPARQLSVPGEDRPGASWWRGEVRRGEARERRLGWRMDKRTDGSRLDHVADGESLDRLVLGGASRAVAAANGLDVAATLLVTAAVEELAGWRSGGRARGSRRVPTWTLAS